MSISILGFRRCRRGIDHRIPRPGQRDLGPRGQLATRVVTPRLPVAPRLVPGPPKRFAQGIGAVLSVTAAVLALGFGLPGAGYVVLGALLVAAALEAGLGLCLGCHLFALLMRAGVIPREVCERCADLGRGRVRTRRAP